MDTWRRGRRVHLENVRSESMPLPLFLERADKTPSAWPALGVFLSSRTDVVPGALLHNLKHNKVLHERVVIANVVVEDTPLVPPEKRLEVEKLGKGFYSVRVHHGFFETPDVPQALRRRPPLRPGAGCRHRDLLHRPRDPGAGRAFRTRPLAQLALPHHRGQRAVAGAVLSPAAQPRRRTRHADRDLNVTRES